MKPKLLLVCLLAFSYFNIESYAQVDVHSFGVFEEHEYIYEGLVVGGGDNLYLWNGFTAVEEEPYFGDDVLSYVHDASTWNGFGIHASKMYDFYYFYDGFMRLALKVPTPTGDFRIGFKGEAVDGVEPDWVINFGAGQEPYGFVRDEEWHELMLPIADFVSETEGVPVTPDDLDSLKILLYVVGNVDISIDEVYYSQDEYDPEPSSIKSDNFSKEISIYPNPARDYLVLKNVVGTSSIRIIDATGRLISGEESTDNKIDVSKLNRGIYFIQIENGDTSVTQKFLKE